MARQRLTDLVKDRESNSIDWVKIIMIATFPGAAILAWTLEEGVVWLSSYMTVSH